MLTKTVENSKLALNAHFNSVPTKYISDIFKAHPNYYEAFFVVEKADRENDGSPAAPFVRIKIRRPPGMSLSRTMQMYENAGHDLEDLKQEMREAEQRWQKEQGTTQSLLTIHAIYEHRERRLEVAGVAHKLHLRSSYLCKTQHRCLAMSF